MTTYKVSYVVLNYNRAARLRSTLESIRQQDYPDKEIIVADNGSTDGSVEMVRQEFPEAVLVTLGRNLGIAGRNAGIRASTGDYVLCLDNDMTFLSLDVTRLAVERMEQQGEVAALSLFVAEPSNLEEFTPTHWWHPRPRHRWQYAEFPTSHFNEAAVLFRKECLDQVGAYPEELFWACEEMDLALRILDAGWDILYFPPAKMLHNEPRGILNVQANPRHALITRNRFWIVLKHYPLPMAVRYIVPRVVLWGCRSVRYGYTGDFLRGLLQFLAKVPRILRTRQVIGPATVRRLREIETAGRAG
ncbi:MAG: glycosyltransferase family 2 protein [Candidatus Hydrogenedentota bacterium]|nr:MAG: glycosyltransferase family 2 protein [Candidatus Hydrogenedentota bacterium]